MKSKISIAILAAVMSSQGIASENPKTFNMDQFWYSVKEVFNANKILEVSYNKLEEGENVDDRIKQNYLASLKSYAELLDKRAEERANKYSPKEKLTGKPEVETLGPFTFDPNKELVKLYSIYANKDYNESASYTFDFIMMLRADKNLELNVVNGDVLSLDYGVVKEYLLNDEALSLFEEEMLAQGEERLNKSGLFVWNRVAEYDWGSVSQNHNLYDVKRMDLLTGLESHELMSYGENPVADDASKIMVCNFFNTINHFYEMKESNIPFFKDMFLADDLFCLDGDEKIEYFTDRKEDFVGVIGHWVKP